MEFPELDEIRYEEDDLENIPAYPRYTHHEPTVVRGSGNITLFGLNNHFCEDFPSELQGRVAPEEFSITMRLVNDLLRKTMTMNIKWLICGCLCCCCTMGCSMWPVICLNRRTRRTLEKALDGENQRVYNKLGLHWSLKKHRSDSSFMVEYILQLEFIPKLSLFRPD